MTRLQANTTAAALEAIPVFYSPKMVADIESFSPSSSKPKHVIQSWRRLGVPLKVIEPVPVSVDRFCMAHDRAYVEDILACRISNGFGNKSSALAASLPWTSGALLSASREAMANGLVAVAPAAGFHHSGYDFGGGFCSLNGIATAATVLLNEGRANHVAILDCDAHFADGTEDILQELHLADVVQHFTTGKNWRKPNQAYDFLILLPSIVEAFSRCDLLIFQAGADAHIDDELGGGWLTTPQMTARDRIVFQTCRRIGLPVSWCLGGGYQSPLRRILNLHDATMQMCADVFAPLIKGSRKSMAR